MYFHFLSRTHTHTDVMLIYDLWTRTKHQHCNQLPALPVCLFPHEKWIIFAAAFKSCHHLLSDLTACRSGEVCCLLPLGQLSCYKEALFKLSDGHFYLPLIFTLANQQSLMFRYLRIQHAFFLLFFGWLSFPACLRPSADALRVFFFFFHIRLLSQVRHLLLGPSVFTPHPSRLVFSRRLYKQADSAF